MSTVPYTSGGRPRAESSDQLRARIPGWGVDLDPHDRPSVPRLQLDPGRSGAHWDFPERQPERWPRERSIEHGLLPPVFGTSTPPSGLSGGMRKYAYRRFSEARAAHWLLLLAADRVDAVESHLRSFATLRPDNPITQTGVRSELSHHGLRSRVGTKRVDLVHQPLDPLIVAGPWVVAGGVVYAGVRSAVRALRRGPPCADRPTPGMGSSDHLLVEVPGVMIPGRSSLPRERAPVTRGEPRDEAVQTVGARPGAVPARCGMRWW